MYIRGLNAPFLVLTQKKRKNGCLKRYFTFGGIVTRQQHKKPLEAKIGKNNLKNRKNAKKLKNLRKKL